MDSGIENMEVEDSDRREKRNLTEKVNCCNKLMNLPSFNYMAYLSWIMPVFRSSKSKVNEHERSLAVYLQSGNAGLSMNANFSFIFFFVFIWFA